MKFFEYLVIGFLTLITLHSPYAVDKEDSELPNDPVLSLNEQEQLFVSAYRSLRPEEIHPLATPIPGLAPMIRMHYSYVAGFVGTSPSHLNLLTQFWQQTAKTIHSNQLTIGSMRSITMQLALLLTDWQKGILEKEWKDENHHILYQSDRWKDIENYNNEGHYFPLKQDSCRYPFYCEAILCTKKGNFSYERFVRNYLDLPFVMHLAALTPRNEEVHGGLVAESADYLWHDLGHNELLASSVLRHQEKLHRNPQTKHLVYWDTLRSLLKKIREGKLNPDLNNSALCFMIREAVPSLVGDKHIPWLELPEEETTIPLSERKLFLCAVANSTKYTRAKLDDYANAPLGSLKGATRLPIEEGEKPWNCSNITTSAILGTAKQNHEGILRGSFRIQKSLSPQSTEGHKIPQSIEVGTFSITYTLLPTDDPLKELIMVSKADNLRWTETVQSQVSPEEQQMIAQDISKWSYAVSADSRFKLYLLGVKDNGKMLRSLYGDDCLPSSNTHFLELSPAIDQGMKKFWSEFYLTNKSLFSDTPLENELHNVSSHSTLTQ